MRLFSKSIFFSLFLITLVFPAVSVIKVGDYFELANKQSAQAKESAKKILKAEDFSDCSLQHGSGLEDVEFVVEISPKLTPYVFHLIPDLTAKFPVGYVIPQHVGTIEISKQGVPGILQRIEVKSHIPDLTWFADYFKAQDVNFDGYLDIAVTSDFGGKWMSYHYWLFDPASGKFVTNKLTQQLGKLMAMNTIELDPELKTIHLRFLNNDQARIGETYKIEDDQLVLIEIEETQGDCEGNFQQLTVKIINGKREGKDVITLEPCKQITQNIAAGQTHHYRIGLDAGQTLRIQLSPGEFDLAMTLFGPDRSRLAVAESTETDQVGLSYIADVTGIYRLDVRPLKEKDAAGTYYIWIEPRSRQVQPHQAECRLRRATLIPALVRAAES